MITKRKFRKVQFYDELSDKPLYGIQIFVNSKWFNVSINGKAQFFESPLTRDVNLNNLRQAETNRVKVYLN